MFILVFNDVVVVLPAVMSNGDVLNPLAISGARGAVGVQFRGEDGFGVVMAFVSHYRCHGTSKRMASEIDGLGRLSWMRKDIALHCGPEIIDLLQESTMDKAELRFGADDFKIGFDIFHLVSFGAAKCNDDIAGRLESPSLGVVIVVELAFGETKGAGLSSNFFFVEIVAFAAVLVCDFSEDGENATTAVEIHLGESVVGLFWEGLAFPARAEECKSGGTVELHLLDFLDRRGLLASRRGRGLVSFGLHETIAFGSSFKLVGDLVNANRNVGQGDAIFNNVVRGRDLIQNQDFGRRNHNLVRIWIKI